MIKFINNTGDFFSSNYFDEDFVKKVHDKSGYSFEDQKELQKKITPLKDKYYKYKQEIIEGRLRVRDKINKTHQFHTLLLNALGYDGEHNNYNNPIHFSETEVLPVRHKLFRGDKLHMLIMEMQPLIKDSNEEPDGLFEQRYNIEEEEFESKEQRYHRSQWKDIFQVPDELKISPVIINKAISELSLLDQNERPHYILLLAGNKIFLIEVEKWFRGSYLQFDIEELFSEGTINKKYYSLFYLLLSKEMLAPDSDMVLMDQLEEDSHKSAYEVTKDLKEGIIHAVEALANEALYYKKEVLKEEFDETDDQFEQEIKDDCLSIVYRLLFVFYAESRAELDILPISDSVYQKGYSLEMLRDLEQTQLITDHSRNGYFFHESLHQLFHLMSTGYREGENGANKSFRIRHIDSPLFDDNKLHQLKSIQFRNYVWQDVICQLSLSRKQHKKARGRISYANLGINQLGSVYESLLAYRGFYAEEDYIEVHPKNKPKEGTLLVQRARRDDFDSNEVLTDAQGREVVIPKGQFVYRLSGRDRQKSASYYTPEVLTQCTVKYTLKSILEKVESGEMKALELLDLKLLEPAMGAAAFHNELINQLAEAYLSFRQKELKQKVSPEKYQEELQKIKAYIATNNAYGVDLNPTAIELGKLSLWLNVIHKDMETPFFGYRLGVGNAVVGAWLKAYKKKDIIVAFPSKGTTRQRNTPIKKEWWDKAPKHLQFKLNDAIQRKDDEIYHFLLPDKNMVPSANIKLLKNEFSTEAIHIRNWKSDFCEPITGDEYKRLQKISKAIDVLLDEHYKFQASINAQTNIKGNFFGAYEDEEQGQLGLRSYDEKEQLAAQRNNTNAPYYKLKLIMDYWCSLWFWDMREAVELPTRQQWYDDLEKIINIDLNLFEEEVKVEKTGFEQQAEQVSLFEEPSQQLNLKNYRKDKSLTLKKLGEALQANPDSLFKNKRSEIVNELTVKNSFFHYQLEFIEVFKERGGFDVAVGNPPWLKVTFEEKGLMSEVFPELDIRKTSAPQVRKLQQSFLEVNSQKETYFSEYIQTEASSVFMNAYQNYPLLKGQQTNLYKCVLENGFHWISKDGFLGLIHPEGVYDDPNGYELRKEVYQRLKYHFQFQNQNQKKLFTEVARTRLYSVNIYCGKIGVINFFNINNLYDVSTVDLIFTSTDNSYSGGIKVKNPVSNKYEWNVKGFKSRLIVINVDVLKAISSTIGDKKMWEGTKLVSLHSVEIVNVFNKIGNYSGKVENTDYKISEGWHETNDLLDQKIIRETKDPVVANYEMIYSGPHIFVSNPIYKSAKRESRLKGDYDNVDLEKISKTFYPRTNYIFNHGKLSTLDFEVLDWIQSYKMVFRKMVDINTERTLSGAIIPPNTSHVNGLISLRFTEQEMLLEFSGLSSSIVFDFVVKVNGKSNLYEESLKKLPLKISEKYKNQIVSRTMLLNCLNSGYQNLWENNFHKSMREDCWSIDDYRLKSFSQLNGNWSIDIPLRNLFERRYALIEIDVLVAMAMGMTLSELILIYEVQFPVLQQYEDDTWYDTKGNVAFTNSLGLVSVGVDRSIWNTIKELKAGETYEHTIEKSELYKGKVITYHAPFDKCDRVEDYKTAWAHFEEVFKEKE